MFHIYIIQNKLNDKLYVGKTSNLGRRWGEHIKTASGGKEKYGRNFRAIHTAINKYGKDSFYFFGIEEFDDEIEAYEAEEFWISYFESYRKDIGYNETMGGRGMLSGPNHPLYGTHPTDETRQKLSAARKGRQPSLGMRHTNETKSSFSEQRKGSGNAMYGRHHSEEGKTHISEAKLASPKNKGESHYLATITNTQATEMRELFTNGKTKAEIARLYDTKWLTVHRIIIGEIYKVTPL
jgi:group I intron endonuclease